MFGRRHDKRNTALQSVDIHYIVRMVHCDKELCRFGGRGAFHAMTCFVSMRIVSIMVHRVPTFILSKDSSIILGMIQQKMTSDDG